MSKTIKTRIQNKHDIPENWSKATFIPLPGELIIYDDHYFDANGNKVVVADSIRYKFGDGVTAINELPFVENKKILFEDLFIDSDIVLCLDGGGADSQLAKLDKTILL